MMMMMIRMMVRMMRMMVRMMMMMMVRMVMMVRIVMMMVRMMMMILMIIIKISSDSKEKKFTESTMLTAICVSLIYCRFKTASFTYSTTIISQ